MLKNALTRDTPKYCQWHPRVRRAAPRFETTVLSTQRQQRPARRM